MRPPDHVTRSRAAKRLYDIASAELAIAELQRRAAYQISFAAHTTDAQRLRQALQAVTALELLWTRIRSDFPDDATVATTAADALTALRDSKAQADPDVLTDSLAPLLAAAATTVARKISRAAADVALHPAPTDDLPISR